MALPLHSRLRQQLTMWLNRILVMLFGSQAKATHINPKAIHRILLIRINYRIGNVLFITPLLNALKQQLPHARVDVLIGSRGPASLIKGLDNIENVYDLPRTLLLHPIDLVRFLFHMRANGYDLVININSSSTSDRIATLLAKAPYKLGFYSSDTWLPLTHTVIEPSHAMHTALRPLKIMEVFDDAQTRYPEILDINLKKEEKDAAAAELNKLLEIDDNQRKEHHIIGLFRNARYDKKIADTWWQQWYEALIDEDPNIIIIDILSPDVPHPLNDTVVSYSSKNLRQLGAFMSQLNAFICADTGPMHLACASHVPTIALFNATDPTSFGPLGENNLTLDINVLTSDMVADETIKHLKAL